MLTSEEKTSCRPRHSESLPTFGVAEQIQEVLILRFGAFELDLTRLHTIAMLVQYGIGRQLPQLDCPRKWTSLIRRMIQREHRYHLFYGDR